jgi:hypothetical protein
MICQTYYYDACSSQFIHMNGILIYIGFVVLWLGGVTFALFRMITHYNRLTMGASEYTLKEVLDKIISTTQGNKKHIIELTDAFAKLQDEERRHLQRIGVVHFNPFSDTGGSQSFSMALLDREDNGLIMTSLFARTGNRWYIKHVKKGKGIHVELSKEEETAIKNAQYVNSDRKGE